jgi:hypothetical protein
MMDIKGDFQRSQKKEKRKPFIERHAKIAIPYTIAKFPVERLTLSEQTVRLRATVSGVRPVLFSRVSV